MGIKCLVGLPCMLIEILWNFVFLVEPMLNMILLYWAADLNKGIQLLYANCLVSFVKMYLL